MPKFEVTWLELKQYGMTVEADTEEEAIELAQEDTAGAEYLSDYGIEGDSWVATNIDEQLKQA